MTVTEPMHGAKTRAGLARGEQTRAAASVEISPTEAPGSGVRIRRKSSATPGGIKTRQDRGHQHYREAKSLASRRANLSHDRKRRQTRIFCFGDRPSNHQVVRAR